VRVLVTVELPFQQQAPLASHCLELRIDLEERGIVYFVVFYREGDGGHEIRDFVASVLNDRFVVVGKQRLVYVSLFLYKDKKRVGSDLLSTVLMKN
jgi:hypothetical protein